ncbi:MAG TPA: hypothetical protein VGC90_02090 [Candidatus Limnocylindrales bacterium]
MIVVIGNPMARSAELGGGVEGTAARSAIAAARAGATVQLVGKAGEDAAGDAVILALAAAGVGHVALLRDASHPTPVVVGPAAPPSAAAPAGDDGDGGMLTAVLAEDEPADDLRIAPEAPADRPTLEPADVELALRYLTDFRAVVIAEPLPDALVAVVVEAASYVGAELVVVRDGTERASLPPGALVLEAPRRDSEGGFATMLGELAAAIDRGATGRVAFEAIRDRVGVSAVSD